MSSESPEQVYLALIASSNPTDAETVTSLSSTNLKINPSHPPSSLASGSFPTLGHPVSEALVQTKWVGKRFHSEDDVEPVVVRDEQGNLVWCEDWGRAGAVNSTVWCLLPW
ncbi:hypothetical protein FB45DRAFT_1129169 [Roridomyces roridus]|uniref:GXWXG domain-containing protein n=1 Tax=Roridomyces roridus TaxID=1738132 RepID=A0AAD7B291_9AGAR|nr:hypothetical protein FB45DRAFT_1129169 [Roridomyces roridus]